MLLTKGIEVEMYTGTPQGEIVGFSDKIVQALEGFSREPDSRNVEYTTNPLRSYRQLLCQLIKPRLRLRNFLDHLGDYTLLPGSSLSLGNSKRFYRSDPGNPYHDYIENTYGTNVVTASLHLNVGVDKIEDLFRALRLIRLEASLYLALSASSPFQDGEPTGNHSTRWQSFPKTHADMPVFVNHEHYIHWTQEQLQKKTMQNVRHLWISVRPNGKNRPYEINRVELRICDLVSDPVLILGLTAMLEARIMQILENPELDPLTSSNFGKDNHKLVELVKANENLVSTHSLDARVHHWKDGRLIRARDWIWEIYQEIQPLARQKGFEEYLAPVLSILENGNEAQQWLQWYNQGMSIQEIFSQVIREMMLHEKELINQLCGEPV